jgi:nucleotide-binding universal stress UspA family protein
LELLTVLQSEPVLAPDNMYLGEPELLRRRTIVRQAVEQQVARVLGPETIVSVTVMDGNAAYAISRVAIERRVACIVIGLGRHFIAHRLFGNEVAVQLARIARVPMLAVPGDARTAPRHAVVAVDFSDLSTRAAQAALDAVADGGCVDLVHVAPLVVEGAFTIAPQEPYQRWAEGQLAALARQLVVPMGITLKTVLLHGTPASEVLNYVARAGADLISTGTHGQGFIARAFLGSVTTKLLRGATCSLLTVPRDPLPAPVRLQHEADAGTPSPLAWGSLLAAFTLRNAGRRTILEVDDLEIGVQSQEYNYPFLGASFSERDGRVDLMLGDQFAGGRHLARTMGSVVAVDVLTDAADHDVALRIQHGASQTLLTFVADQPA